MLNNKKYRRSAQFRKYFTFLTLDQYVFARFVPSFLLTLLFSTIIFVLLWLILRGIGVNWSLGDAFIQLTNPSTVGDGENGASFQEWMGVVVTNLFGLFILNGVILTLLVNWVSNRKDRYERGESRYNYIFKRNFVVIIGGHKIVSSLARDLLQKKDIEFVVIQTQRDATEIRREIEAEVNSESFLRHVVIYSGNRTSWHELAELCLSKAQEVYIIGEPAYIDGSSHDSINMQTWKLINTHFQEKRELKIPCHIMFEYQSTFCVFQNIDLRLENSHTFRFLPFSIYENWAQQVLVCPKINHETYYIPLDGIEGLTYNSPQRVHLIIIGMSKMGMALAIEASHIAHYPNFLSSKNGKPRTLITFIDRNAGREMRFFMGRFRELFRLARWREVVAPEGTISPNDESWKIYDTSEEITLKSNRIYPWHDPMKDPECGSPYCGDYLGEDLIDIDFEFIEGDVSLPSIQKYIADACADKPSITRNLNNVGHQADHNDKAGRTTIAVCIPDAAQSISIALYMDRSVYENAQQIWVLQTESGALADAIQFGETGAGNGKYSILRPFGMLNHSDYLDRANNILPKIVAYAYDCLNRGTSLYEEYQKFDSIEVFKDAVESFWLSISSEGGKSAVAKRYSNIYCANSFDTRIRASRIDISGGDCKMDAGAVTDFAKVEHNRWVMEQLLLGIRPVGKEYKDRLPVDDSKERTELKKRNIHPDLISNEMLGSTQFYDEEIAKIIPLALKISESMKK